MVVVEVVVEMVVEMVVVVEEVVRAVEVPCGDGGLRSDSSPGLGQLAWSWSW